MKRFIESKYENAQKGPAKSQEGFTQADFEYEKAEGHRLAMQHRGYSEMREFLATRRPVEPNLYDYLEEEDVEDIGDIDEWMEGEDVDMGDDLPYVEPVPNYVENPLPKKPYWNPGAEPENELYNRVPLDVEKKIVIAPIHLEENFVTVKDPTIEEETADALAAMALKVPAPVIQITSPQAVVTYDKRRMVFAMGQDDASAIHYQGVLGYMYGDDVIVDKYTPSQLLFQEFSLPCCRYLSHYHSCWELERVPLSDYKLERSRASKNGCSSCDFFLQSTHHLLPFWSAGQDVISCDKKKNKTKRRFRKKGKNGPILLATEGVIEVTPLENSYQEDSEKFFIEALVCIRNLYVYDIASLLRPFLRMVSQANNRIRTSHHERHATQSLPPQPVSGTPYGLYIKRAHRMTLISGPIVRVENWYIVCPDGPVTFLIGDSRGKWRCGHSHPVITKVAGEGAVRMAHSQYPPRPERSAIYRIRPGCSHTCHRSLVVVRVHVKGWSCIVNVITGAKSYHTKMKQDTYHQVLCENVFDQFFPLE